MWACRIRQKALFICSGYVRQETQCGSTALRAHSGGKIAVSTGKCWYGAGAIQQSTEKDERSGVSYRTRPCLERRLHSTTSEPDCHASDHCLNVASAGPAGRHPITTTAIACVHVPGQASKQRVCPSLRLSFTTACAVLGQMLQRLVSAPSSLRRQQTPIRYLPSVSRRYGKHLYPENTGSQFDALR